MKWCNTDCDDGWVNTGGAFVTAPWPCPACREARDKAGNPGAFVVSVKQADKYALLARYRAALEAIAEFADGCARLPTRAGIERIAHLARAALGKE